MKREKILVFVIALCVAIMAVPLRLAASDEDHGGDVVYTIPLKAVLFSHKTHVEDVEMDCDTCHDDIFEMESLAVQQEDDFTMQALYEGKYCGACHDGSTAFSSDSQCARCHIGVKGYKRLQGEDTDGEGHNR
jgi:c(7)-type cytochrome triheme protein